MQRLIARLEKDPEERVHQRCLYSRDTEGDVIEE
jgi:hypothetical protein